MMEMTGMYKVLLWQATKHDVLPNEATYSEEQEASCHALCWQLQGTAWDHLDHPHDDQRNFFKVCSPSCWSSPCATLALPAAHSRHARASVMKGLM